MSSKAAAWQDAIAARSGQHERGRRQYAQLIDAADMPYEQGGSTPLMTVGAVRRQVGASRTVGAVMQQRRRTHLACRQLEPVQSSII